jgi:hypothetical protein
MNNEKERLIEIFKEASFFKEIKKCLDAYNYPTLEIKEATENPDYLLMFSEKDDKKKFAGLIFIERENEFFIETIGEIYKPESFKIKDKIDHILKNCNNLGNDYKAEIQNKEFWEKTLDIELPKENWEDYEINPSSQILIPFHSKNIINELMVCIREIKKIQNSNEPLSCVTFIKNEKEDEKSNDFVIIGYASTLGKESLKSPNQSS